MVVVSVLYCNKTLFLLLCCSYIIQVAEKPADILQMWIVFQNRIRFS